MNAHAHAFPRPMLQVLDEMPEGEKWEVIDGGLYAQAAGASEHNSACDGFTSLLRGAYQHGLGGPGGWWIIGKQRVIGPDAEQLIVQPDLAGWRRERMLQLETPYIHVRPDWVCEVLSPSTRARDLGKKQNAYAGLGVPWYWIVDVDLQTIDVRRLDGGAYKTTHRLENAQAMALPPFLEVVIEPGIVFS